MKRFFCALLILIMLVSSFTLSESAVFSLFQISNYEYKVPSEWESTKHEFGEEYSHFDADRDISLSVNWKNHEGADMESALQMLYKMYPGLPVEFLKGETIGFLMDGKCITGLDMIKACIVGYPGYVEITYRHDNSETQREEFDQILAGFRKVK